MLLLTIRSSDIWNCTSGTWLHSICVCVYFYLYWLNVWINAIHTWINKSVRILLRCPYHDNDGGELARTQTETCYVYVCALSDSIETEWSKATQVCACRCMCVHTMAEWVCECEWMRQLISSEVVRSINSNTNQTESNTIRNRRKEKQTYRRNKHTNIT